MTDRLREYIYWLACVIAVVWLAFGVADIAIGLGRGKGIKYALALVVSSEVMNKRGRVHSIKS